MFRHTKELSLDSQLISAVKAKKEDVVSVLLEQKANGNAKDNSAAFLLNRPVLVEAASKKANGIVKLLLKANANPNAQCDDGYTALMFAAHTLNKELAEILLEAKADLFLTDSHKRSAIDVVKGLVEGDKYYDLLEVLQNAEEAALAAIPGINDAPAAPRSRI